MPIEDAPVKHACKVVLRRELHRRQHMRADRFAADLGLAERIEDPGLREFVRAANGSPVPVVLGGHSLVAGGLMLLNDWAWEQRDGVRRPASAVD